MVSRTAEGSLLTPTHRLGVGGEAEVFAVAEHPHLAFKRYFGPRAGRDQKLRVMVANPPEVAASVRGHVALAWPRELIVGPGARVEGFLMPRVDRASSVPLFQVYNPASRARLAPAFTWKYLLRTARNLAGIVESLHAAGYVVGDLNESNLLVSNRALVALVDCDSMQVRDPDTSAVYPCVVGKAEFTAPELHGADFTSTERRPESDAFALAVLVFLLLMEGTHPYAGVWRGRGEPPDVPARMRRGRFPYRLVPLGSLRPPPLALDLGVLPLRLRRMVRRTFATGSRRPSARPTAAEWVDALTATEASLRTCRRSPHHVFSGHRRRCPWCARLAAGLPDAFPGPSGKSALPPPKPRKPPRQLTKRAARRARRVATEHVWPRIGQWLEVLPPIAPLLLVASAASVVPVPALVAAVVVGAAGSWRRRCAVIAAATAAVSVLSVATLAAVPWVGDQVASAGRSDRIALLLRICAAAASVSTTFVALRDLAERARRWRVSAWVAMASVLCALVIGARWWPLPADLPDLLARALGE